MWEFCLRTRSWWSPELFANQLVFPLRRETIRTIQPFFELHSHPYINGIFNGLWPSSIKVAPVTLRTNLELKESRKHSSLSGKLSAYCRSVWSSSIHDPFNACRVVPHLTLSSLWLNHQRRHDNTGKFQQWSRRVFGPTSQVCSSAPNLSLRTQMGQIWSNCDRRGSSALGN